MQVEFRQQRPALGVRACPPIRSGSPAIRRPSDRLLIFEDTNNDGKADKV